MKLSLAAIAAAVLAMVATTSPGAHAEVAAAEGIEQLVVGGGAGVAAGVATSVGAFVHKQAKRKMQGKCTIFDAVNRKVPKLALYAAQCGHMADQLPIIALRALADKTARNRLCKCDKFAQYVLSNKDKLPDCELPLGKPAISARDFLVGIVNKCGQTASPSDDSLDFDSVDF